jgi:PleD family two-component response regulator
MIREDPGSRRFHHRRDVVRDGRGQGEGLDAGCTAYVEKADRSGEIHRHSGENTSEEKVESLRCVVLIVDDQEANRYLLKALLTGAGNQAAEVSHGKAAWKSSRRNISIW